MFDFTGRGDGADQSEVQYILRVVLLERYSRQDMKSLVRGMLNAKCRATPHSVLSIAS